VLNEIKKDFYIVGENWDESNPSLLGEQFNSVTNYRFTFTVWNFFCKDIYSTHDFKNEINLLLTTYPKNVINGLFNLLDSHKTERILSICGENINKVKLAYLFLLTFSGTPSLYYGSEIGLTGKEDPDNKRCMIWDKSNQNLSLHRFIKSLIQIRKLSKALQSGDFYFIQVTEKINQIIYQKRLDEECITVFINSSKNDNILDIPQELYGHKVINLLTHEEFYLEKNVKLEPYGYLLIQVI